MSSWIRIVSCTCMMTNKLHVSLGFLCSGDITACVLGTREVKGEGITSGTTEASSKYRINLGQQSTTAYMLFHWTYRTKTNCCACFFFFMNLL